MLAASALTLFFFFFLPDTIMGTVKIPPKPAADKTLATAPMNPRRVPSQLASEA
jgi:hypothetical protein